MSRKSLAKTHDEVYLDLINDYRKQFGPEVRWDDFGKWVDENNLLPKPKISAAKIFTRNAKQAAQRSRFIDRQGRKVRSFIPAQYEAVDSHGNKYIDVVWNHLHESSGSHLLTHFSQRDSLIEKQRRSATRDLQSALENNPNAIGLESQFQFGFMTDEPVEQVVSQLSESEIALPEIQPIPSPKKKKRKPR